VVGVVVAAVGFVVEVVLGAVVVVVGVVEFVVGAVALGAGGLVVVATDGDTPGEVAAGDGAAKAKMPLTNPQASVAAALRPSLGRRRQ
jgi:hypothetical protein